MPFEDMGIMRGIPTMTVIEPTDIAMLKNLLPKIAKTYGMHYLRLVRKSVKKSMKTDRILKSEKPSRCVRETTLP